MLIDAHHHFWDPSRHAYPWLAGEKMAPLQRAFGPGDLAPALASAGVGGTVLVQTISSLEETRQFLQLSAATEFVSGVVGWADLTSPDLGEELDGLRAGPGGSRLVGLRHQVQDEEDREWLGRPDVLRGLATVASRGLVYDLLVRAREIPAAVRAVAATPDLQFVVDHLGKPAVASGDDHEWHARMPALAAFPNVAAKVSGLVTEADWDSWSAADLEPYVHAALGWFGPQRLMWGSDWPVCLLAGGYTEVLNAAREALGDLSPAEEGAVFAGTAARVYALNKGCR
ncbi:MAG TPA: amidohydrolase family protein [Acidimicrobiales bacterium]|nr:amidohydrolase family protein [Acidimicrobiales bacterium]